MLHATEVRAGNVIKYKDGIWKVSQVTHNTPGNKRAIIMVKMKNIESGVTIEERFSSGDKIEQAIIETFKMEYLYADGDQFIFMNQESFEQTGIHKDVVGEDAQWMKENTICDIKMFEENCIGVDVPNSVDLKVVETEPELKGATKTNVNKSAKLETGAMVKVPPFIAEGEVIKIDTRTGEYLGRSNE